MSQGELFDFSNHDGHVQIAPRARASDPVTSTIAAQAVENTASVLQRLFIESLAQLGEATANEVARRAAAKANVMPESVRKRAGELFESGLISVSTIRKCGVTGKLAQVYKVRGSQNGTVEGAGSIGNGSTKDFGGPGRIGAHGLDRGDGA
jgi:hypothetical protein